MTSYPKDLDSLVSYLQEHRRIYCHHTHDVEVGERTFSHWDGRALHFFKVPSGDKSFLPIHRPNAAYGPANIGFLEDGFVLTMFGVSIKYEYLSQCGKPSCSCARLTPRKPDEYAWWSNEFDSLDEAKQWAATLPPEADPRGEWVGDKVRVFYKKDKGA
jgi:hypothetical protein